MSSKECIISSKNIREKLSLPNQSLVYTSTANQIIVHFFLGHLLSWVFWEQAITLINSSILSPWKFWKAFIFQPLLTMVYINIWNDVKVWKSIKCCWLSSFSQKTKANPKTHEPHDYAKIADQFVYMKNKQILNVGKVAKWSKVIWT